MSKVVNLVRDGNEVLAAAAILLVIRGAAKPRPLQDGDIRHRLPLNEKDG
jgi:hypothetical protein